MRFDLKPWDRNRPRLHPPLADCVVQHNGKTFGLRARNGILFFRDQSDEAKTWAMASPLPTEVENDPSKFEAFWRREFERGNVARVVVPLVMLHVFNKRPIPLFLKGDGTGFARESWNRDDIAFSHRVSMHDFLEGSDETLLAGLRDVERQLEGQLSQLQFPPETAFEEEEIEWACGSPEELQTVIEWVCALETRLWTSDDTRAVSVAIAAENAFARAHVHRLEFLTPNSDSLEDAWYEPAPSSDVLEIVAEELFEAEPDGITFHSTGRMKPAFLPSNRFWRLMDVALDANTPMGLYWQYTDQGAGRCADAPEAPTLAFSTSRPSPSTIEAAREHLRAYLESAVPRAEVEDILGDDAPRDLPKHKW